MSKGKALFLEHLPYIHFAGSVQGVLFLVFANGEAFFYPLNDKTKGGDPHTSSSARLITLEHSGRKLVKQSGSIAHSLRAALSLPLSLTVITSRTTRILIQKRSQQSLAQMQARLLAEATTSTVSTICLSGSPPNSKCSSSHFLSVERPPSLPKPIAISRGCLPKRSC